ncbi:MAG: hypothetical protein LBD30_02690, partial [Verrucomicrobiales bacterium]|nr:hypothetical protein [Verrucomicrobiales bacterium]
MKLTNISKWAALLVAVSGMAALPLSISGFPLINQTSGGTTTLAVGGTYSTSLDGSPNGLVLLAGNGGVIVGNNNTLISTGSGARVANAFSSGSEIRLGVNTTIKSSGAQAFGIWAQNNSMVSAIDGLRVTTTGYAAIAVYAYSDSTIDLGDHAVIKSLGGAHAVFSIGKIKAKNLLVVTGTSGGRGLFSSNNIDSVAALLEVNGGTVITAADTGVMVINPNSVLTGTNLAVYTGVNLNADGDMLDANGNVTTDPGQFTAYATGSGYGLIASNSGLMELWDSSVTTLGGPHSAAIYVSNSGTVILHGGQLTSSEAVVYVNGSGVSEVILDHVNLVGADGIVTNSTFTGTATVNINGGSGIHGDVTNSGSGALTVNLDNSSLTGDVTGNNSGTLNINASNSVLIGDITANDDAALTVNLDNASELTGKIDPVDLSV